MAAITTAASGNWSATGTWTGGVVPGDGDTVTLNHAVTVDQNTVVGSAPATGGTAAIQANAALTVAAGIALEVKGDVSLNNVALTLGAGASLLINPAVGVEYRLHIGTAHSQANPRLLCNGTSGSHVTVRKKSGAAGTAAIPGSFIASGRCVATWTDFIALGSSSVLAHRLWADLSGYPSSFEDCTWDGCGKVEVLNAHATAQLRWERCRWTNSAASFSWKSGGSNNITGAGFRQLIDCAFDKGIEQQDRGYLWTRVVIGAKPSFLSTSTMDAASSDVFFVIPTGGSPITLPRGTLTRWYALVITNTNPHWIQQNQDVTQVLDRWIFENDGTATTGDALLLAAPSVARTVTLQHSILLPNNNDVSPGKIVAALGGANTTCHVLHNTYRTDGSGECGVGVGETYAGHAGMIAAFKSNLAWNDVGSTGFKFTRIGGTVQDIVAAANADFNAGWNLAAGTEGNGYDANGAPSLFSSGTPDVNGVTLSADPFVDRTRKLATWDASLGGPGTAANAVAQMLARAAGYTVDALIDYVFAGYAVTDAALQNAGHDGATIGAGTFQAAAGGAAFLKILFNHA